MTVGIKLVQSGVTLAAGTAVHPAPIAVDVGILCFLSFTGTTSTYEWALTSRPAGSGTVMSSRTSHGPTILTDIDGGSYTVTFTDSSAVVYTLDIVTATITPSTGNSSFEVADYGGLPNALYFHTDGKWYADAAHLIEATDDAPKFIAAMAAASANGGGNVHFGAGNWYFRNAPTGAHGEYVVVPSGVTLYGDGDASCIRISPGRLTGATNTGYACVFGDNSATSHADTHGYINNVRFRDFRIDHNSQFNQMNATGGAGLTYGFGASVWVARGANIRLQNLTSINHATRFNFVAGLYGYQDQTFNVIIDGCQCLHEGDDPKVGDTSCIVASAFNFQATNNTVDTDLDNNVAWPTGNLIITAFEIHSTNGIVAHNVARYTARFLNLAGDSLDQDQFIVSHNIADGCISGITLYEFSSHTINGLDIGHNQLNIRQGDPSFGEAGIAVADPAAQLLPDGNGILHARFHHNKIQLKYGSPTASFSFGMNMLGRAVHVRIHDNDISGFGTVGIFWLATSRAANAGNLLQQFSIDNNKIYQCGGYGIFVGGKVGEAADIGISVHVKDNEIVDDRGGGAQMAYGVYINARCDSDLSVWKNRVVGALTADTFLDTATYPTMANKPDTFSTDVKVVGSQTVTVALRVGGTSAPLQSLHVSGAALISSEFMQSADNTGAAFAWNSNTWSIFRDTGACKSTNGANTIIGWSNSGQNLGFYGVTPVGRATAYTQTYATASKTHPNQTQQTLTDSSGGSASTTLAAITGGGAGCENATKNAVASLAARLAEIQTDVLALKQLVNAVIDDDQSVGLKQ